MNAVYECRNFSIHKSQLSWWDNIFVNPTGFRFFFVTQGMRHFCVYHSLPVWRLLVRRARSMPYFASGYPRQPRAIPTPRNTNRLVWIWQLAESCLFYAPVDWQLWLSWVSSFGAGSGTNWKNYGFPYRVLLKISSENFANMIRSGQWPSPVSLSISISNVTYISANSI